MTTTPTIWKPGFVANAPTGGIQSAPQAVGLANGNILVVWEDDTQGASPGIDIRGQIFDPEGVALGPAFDVNKAVYNSAETGPEIVALPDGGYVVAYGSFTQIDGGFIVIERFNSLGQSTAHNFVLDEQSSLTKWELTADPAGNYTLVFERFGNPGDVNIYSTTYNYQTNVAGPVRATTAQNSSEDDYLGGVAAFANGHIVTFYNEQDTEFVGFPPQPFAYHSVEFTIIDPATGTRTRGPTDIAGESFPTPAFAEDLAVLSGGQFVMLYTRFAGGEPNEPNLYLRIGVSEGGTIGDEIRVAAILNPDVGENDAVGAQVVALDDGTFVVVWHDLAPSLLGQRFSAGGTPIGGTFSVALDAADFATSELSLTADGRILVPYVNTSGEISLAILDARETSITGTDASEVITTQTQSPNGTTLLFGAGGDDLLLGQGLNDIIEGGTGADILDGGLGDDIYVLRDSFRSAPMSLFFRYDIVIEAAGAGNDTVWVQDTLRASNYTLTANVENGEIIGNGGFMLTGNTLDNLLIGNADTNALYGVAGRDTLAGNGGDDTLDGGIGADTMNGGAGNDLFYVDNAGDVVIEGAAQGTADRVFTTVDYALSVTSEVEIISTTDHAGTAVIDLSGSIYGQTLMGNAGSNILDGKGGADAMVGRAGDDWFYVDNAGDTVNDAVGEGALDRVFASAHYTLNAGAQIEIISTTNHAGTTAINLAGNEFAQTLQGNAGANVLDGKGGADAMVGRAGNDSFYVDTAGDTINDRAGEGTADRVFAGVSYALGAAAEIEILSTTSTAGTVAINLTGNALAQTIYGNNGANVLNGGLGNDTLQGFAGADVYLFNTALNAATNVDTVVGYDIAQNVIQLENAIFTGLANGALAAGAFRIGAAAADADDRILYNGATGALFFDADGVGGIAAVQFATLSGAPAVTATEFFVV